MKVKRIAISLPFDLAKEFEEAIRKRGYSNRSKALADIIRLYLAGLEWEKGGNKIGCITILYEHDVRGVLDRITDIQHKFNKIITSSIHVHLGKECLEVIVAKGDGKEIEKLAHELISTRGVKYGKLNTFSKTEDNC